MPLQVIILRGHKKSQPPPNFQTNNNFSTPPHLLLRKNLPPSPHPFLPIKIIMSSPRFEKSMLLPTIAFSDVKSMPPLPHFTFSNRAYVLAPSLFLCKEIIPPKYVRLKNCLPPPPSFKSYNSSSPPPTKKNPRGKKVLALLPPQITSVNTVSPPRLPQRHVQVDFGTSFRLTVSYIFGVLRS